METVLIQTKLYIPPTRPALVSRPRLIEHLNAGFRQTHSFARKLSLISAPAGFGKTTLVNDWVRAGVRSQTDGVGEEKESKADASSASQALLPAARFVWLPLDEGDNDHNRFLSYFVAALQTIKANMGHGVLSTLQSS